MKIWAISDTHANHRSLTIPEVDCVLYGGDSTNYRDLVNNNKEFYDFKNWFINLPIKHKVIIAGNHDAWATKKYNIDDLKINNIIYLEHEYYDLEGITLFGSPYTPTFCDWYFMKDRSKLYKYWEVLNEKKIDILLTHGPPKGILDLSHNRANELEYCGDNTLFNKVMETKPKYHIFGHIHNNRDCYNQGLREYKDIKFLNVSCVTDGKINELSSNGLIIDL